MASRQKKGGSRNSPVNLELPPPPPSSAPPPSATPPARPLQTAAPPPPYASWWPGSGAGNLGGQSTSANPRGSYFNLLQQPLYPPLQSIGENSYFVGVAKSMNPPSPATTPIGRVSIDIDVDDGAEASRGVKKRFWSHDEEVRLASAWLNTSKDPIHGNDKKSDSLGGQITEKFNKNS
ncbi:hypothetical protein PAHAL_6G215000 [Panicum hallii]|uniref:Myb-like domain-containing protein n=1 Tax=Panicum hallii TaxID=206008 RepID=A0A2T8IH94_9POAL|nr:hypothetical protein PAHAL_6G215000 [Panicum hallii]